MATASRSLCRAVFQITRQVPVKRKRQQLWRTQVYFSKARLYSSSAPRDEDDNSVPSGTQTASPKITSQSSASTSSSGASKNRVRQIDYATIDTSELKVPDIPITVEQLSPEERADYEVLSKDEQSGYLAVQNHFKALTESPESDQELERLAQRLAREVDKQENINFPNVKLQNAEIGYWAEDDEDEFAQVEDDDDEGAEEGITSVAESELELHREMRDYTRIAAWDMPLLTKFAKPFEPPPLTSPLRFRYTTFMGESHPSAKKVVVQFCTRDLPDLTESQRIKLIKLVGVRYNPDTDVVKMSCEKFEAPAQNKRYLGDLIGKLVTEARNGQDMFEDVPLDFRHHKPKRPAIFPKEWEMTPERIQMLMEQRKDAKLLSKAQKPLRVTENKPVDQYVTMSTRSRILA